MYKPVLALLGKPEIIGTVSKPSLLSSSQMCLCVQNSWPGMRIASVEAVWFSSVRSCLAQHAASLVKLRLFNAHAK